LHLSGATTGHDEQGRARGTSSKGDLHDLVFNMRQAKPFDELTVGKVVVTPKLCRVAPGGPWEMRIGGGVFESPELVEPRPPIEDEERLQLVTDMLRGGAPRSASWIEEQLRKAEKGWRKDTLLQALPAWAADTSTAIDEVDGKYVVFDAWL
jgi:hypothetical protein